MENQTKEATPEAPSINLDIISPVDGITQTEESVELSHIQQSLLKFQAKNYWKMPIQIATNDTGQLIVENDIPELVSTSVSPEMSGTKD